MDFTSLVASCAQSQPVTTSIYRSGAASVARLAHSLLKKDKNVVIIAKNMAELTEYKSLLTLFSPDESTESFPLQQPKWQTPFITFPEYPTAFDGKSRWAERIVALYGLYSQHKPQGVLTTLDNFLFRLPPKTFFKNHELVLQKTMDMAPELVLEQAIEWGYVRMPLVNSPGDIALRGDILDIFCPGYAKPLRLEFFGDTLEDIRFFDSTNQRSLGNIAEVSILPVTPIIVSSPLRSAAENFWQQQIEEKRLPKEHLAGLVRELDKGGARLFCGNYYTDASVFEDWLPEDATFILCGETEVHTILEESERVWVHRIAEDVEVEGLYQSRSLVLRSKSEVAQCFTSPKVYVTDLRLGVAENEDALSLPERSFHQFQDLFLSPIAKERPWQTLVATLKSWNARRTQNKKNTDYAQQDDSLHTEKDYATQFLASATHPQLILSFSSERARKRFLTLAEQDGVIPKLRYASDEQGVFALLSPFRGGIALEWDGTLILGEDVMQPRTGRTQTTSHKGVFKGLDNYDSLQENDLLVHRDYGVAMFKGLHRMDFGDIANDYLLLAYAGNDKLYLPVDRLSIIQRFQGGEGLNPALDRLGSTHWLASKEKAKKAIEQIAADLVEMYALRKVVKGFSYTPINEMYREFEASFGFEETPDQSKAIEDVLHDMERPEPMDRLICGDVGFGKTEVAIRAAFRAALEGRQAVVLCPTTILAEQHYQTFRSRLAGFPVNVGMLSRFVSRTRQKEVLEGVAKGQIDILIGTHRLLSKDVILPKLGLLVLDEEQRFGVRHKERLKEMRKNVDALTLTATPIPRTLQLSLSGIRELSVIDTPPVDRKPVVTALIDRDESVLKDLLIRERARNGQVFWVYNRVQGLERVVEFVKKLTPDARVGMAHGQMKEQLLEETMHKFWHGDLDVLVCTSIIESGLDFPRANTLIVDQAHMFGLGQLYQLRGRVGRSDVQAFAVFITPDPHKLSKIARERMRIILEMDYLGAGFKVAMEDLRLRGAGNILGESQSGHMNRVGLELFLEMLEEAVMRLKGTAITTFAETELSLGIPAFIPESYMQESTERLRYYKMLTSATDDQMQQEIVFEIRDRFGKIPQEFESFTEILSFKRYLTSIGVAKADIFMDRAKLAFIKESAPPANLLVEFVTKQQGSNIKLHPPCVLEIPFIKTNLKDNIDFIKNLLQDAFFNKV